MRHDKRSILSTTHAPRSAAFIAVGLALATGLPRLAGAEVATLVPGSAFPAVESRSPSGLDVRLPPASPGPFVAIYADSRKGGDGVTAWSHALYKALPERIGVFAIADLSGVPGLVRGFAVSSIRKQASPSHAEHRDHILVLTERNPLAGEMPAGSNDLPVVIAVDSAGKIVRIEREAYDDAAVAGEAHRIEASLPGAKP